MRTNQASLSAHLSGLVRGKLGSSSGASIVLAVVIFAIASIFSVTIVNAAHSSAGNAVEQMADEQDFLAASSAAQLLQEIVPGTSVTLTGLDSVTGSGTSCTVPDSAKNAKAVLQAMGESLLPRGEEGARVSTKMTFGAVGDMPPVTVTMKPSDDKASYDVTAIVKGERGNAIAVNFVGSGTVADNGTVVSWQLKDAGKQTTVKSDNGKKTP